MSRAVSPGRGTPYGLARLPDLARGPVGPLSDPVLSTEVRTVPAGSPFHGEGYRKVWARRLRLKGRRTLLCRVLRLMREHDLLAPSRTGRRTVHAT